MVAFQQHPSSTIEWFSSFRRGAARRRLLVGACCIGALYGYWYYIPQLLITPTYLWPFVPDCPLFVSFFVVVLLLCELDVRVKMLDGFVLFGLVKYGAWTLFVMLLYFDVYLSALSSTKLLLFAGHIGMVLCALTLVKGLREGLAQWHPLVFTLGFLVLDVMDYVVGTHPTIPPQHIQLVALFSVCTTLAIGAILYAFIRGDSTAIRVDDVEGG